MLYIMLTNSQKGETFSLLKVVEDQRDIVQLLCRLTWLFHIPVYGERGVGYNIIDLVEHDNYNSSKNSLFRHFFMR